MDNIVKLAIDCFEKKADGSWVATKNSDIVTEDGKIIRIAPGMAFTPGHQPWGLDVVQALEGVSEN
jgi:hypothetical protein